MIDATDVLEISSFLQARIDAGDFPSAVYLVAEKGQAVFSGALGNAVVEPEVIPATVDTIYDMASLTKPLVTGLLIAKVFSDKHGLPPLSNYFPQFQHITHLSMITHTSGLPAWKPFYLLAGDNVKYEEKRKRVIDLIAAEPLACEPGSQVVYSDLNYLMLGFMIEEIYGARLDEVARKEIFEPLGLQKAFFNPPAKFTAEIAASERGNNYEKQTCAENGYDVGDYHWREDVIRGEAHDGNAYFLDGVAGHAGIFSTVEETFKIAQQFLAGSSKLIRPEICQTFKTDQTPGLNEARSLAFQLASTPESTASEALAKDSFGHLGFTGTSLWIEPGTERIFILLTNRTHAHGLPFVNINSTRREFHRLAVAALQKR